MWIHIITYLYIFCTIFTRVQTNQSLDEADQKEIVSYAGSQKEENKTTNLESVLDKSTSSAEPDSAHSTQNYLSTIMAEKITDFPKLKFVKVYGEANPEKSSEKIPEHFVTDSDVVAIVPEYNEETTNYTNIATNKTEELNTVDEYSLTNDTKAVNKGEIIMSSNETMEMLLSITWNPDSTNSTSSSEQDLTTETAEIAEVQNNVDTQLNNSTEEDALSRENSTIEQFKEISDDIKFAELNSLSTNTSYNTSDEGEGSTKSPSVSGEVLSDQTVTFVPYDGSTNTSGNLEMPIESSFNASESSPSETTMVKVLTEELGTNASEVFNDTEAGYSIANISVEATEITEANTTNEVSMITNTSESVAPEEVSTVASEGSTVEDVRSSDITPSDIIKQMGILSTSHISNHDETQETHTSNNTVAPEAIQTSIDSSAEAATTPSQSVLIEFDNDMNQTTTTSEFLTTLLEGKYLTASSDQPASAEETEKMKKSEYNINVNTATLETESSTTLGQELKGTVEQEMENTTIAVTEEITASAATINKATVEVSSKLPIEKSLKADDLAKQKWQPFVFDCSKEVDDKGPICDDWANGGLCDTHRPTMFLFCRRTCLCTGPTTKKN